ncbi:MAG: sialate O-acetylesterase, partial [Armatimonadetes bacterium]|nr:sialate O-acetylesterase [Armatimonadota bacterium]
MHIAVVTLVFALAPGASVQADVTLNGMFTDNMVLQRDIAVPVFGKADPGEEMTVSIGGRSRTITTGEDGRWM